MRYCGYRSAAVCFGIVLVAVLGVSACRGADAATLTVKKLDGKVRVEIDGQLFTEYVYKDLPKPILYPVIGPHGIPMTRNYPMKKVPGEAADHPHHRSLWYTHGEVNDTDFWAEGKQRGRIVQKKLLEAAAEGNRAVIKTANAWQRADGSEVCSDTRTLTFFTIPGGRAIDFEITITASQGDLTFGDTKEGTMGIRTHPNLRLDPDARRGVTTANGHALNSEGHRDKALWGKRAKWVDYWGAVDGKVVGIGIFDHVTNPRHPTWWHARNYGLIAANPFGVRHFENKPKGTGDLKIPSGESRTWRYRFVFHEGDAEQAKIPELYKQFAASK